LQIANCKLQILNCTYSRDRPTFGWCPSRFDKEYNQSCGFFVTLNFVWGTSKRSEWLAAGEGVLRDNTKNGSYAGNLVVGGFTQYSIIAGEFQFLESQILSSDGQTLF
jgi:hypothetical protein